MLTGAVNTNQPISQPELVSSVPPTRIENTTIADQLCDYADLLHQQGSDGFRERAYRNAAISIRRLDSSVADVFNQYGFAGLIALKGVGKSIAGAISEFILTGHWSQLDRLNGNLSPQKLFQTIPGIGEVLANRLAEDHHLETLQDLEAALHNDRFVARGLGPRRREAIRAVLAERLKHPVTFGARLVTPAPTVAMLLEVDALYRSHAAAGKLRKIRPKQNNPMNRTWLPVMHERRERWHFTVMYSNTARAHQLGKNFDWVVIYYQQDGQPEGRCTVVTEIHGKQSGKRVVRGREHEGVA